MKNHCKNNSKKSNKKCICCNKTVVTITVLALLIVSTALIYAVQSSLNQQIDTSLTNGGGVVVDDGGDEKIPDGNGESNEIIITEEDLDVSKWKTYIDENSGISFKYPVKLNIIESATNGPDYHSSLFTIILKENKKLGDDSIYIRSINKEMYKEFASSNDKDPDIYQIKYDFFKRKINMERKIYTTAGEFGPIDWTVKDINNRAYYTVLQGGNDTMHGPYYTLSLRTFTPTHRHSIGLDIFLPDSTVNREMIIKNETNDNRVKMFWLIVDSLVIDQ